MRLCGATRPGFALHFGAGAPVAKRENHAWCWPREQGRLIPHPPKSIPVGFEPTQGDPIGLAG